MGFPLSALVSMVGALVVDGWYVYNSQKGPVNAVVRFEAANRSHNSTYLNRDLAMPEVWLGR